MNIYRVNIKERLFFMSDNVSVLGGSYSLFTKLKDALEDIDLHGIVMKNNKAYSFGFINTFLGNIENKQLLKEYSDKVDEKKEDEGQFLYNNDNNFSFSGGSTSQTLNYVPMGSYEWFIDNATNTIVGSTGSTEIIPGTTNTTPNTVLDLRVERDIELNRQMLREYNDRLAGRPTGHSNHF